jgi:hypothetical protein
MSKLNQVSKLTAHAGILEAEAAQSCAVTAVAAAKKPIVVDESLIATELSIVSCLQLFTRVPEAPESSPKACRMALPASLILYRRLLGKRIPHHKLCLLLNTVTYGIHAWLQE